MRLVHRLSKGSQAFEIEVEYDPKENLVTEVVEVTSTSRYGWINITDVLGEWFNLDEVIDKIDWAEKAAS